MSDLKSILLDDGWARSNAQAHAAGPLSREANRKRRPKVSLVNTIFGSESVDRWTTYAVRTEGTFSENAIAKAGPSASAERASDNFHPDVQKVDALV